MRESVFLFVDVFIAFFCLYILYMVALIFSAESL